MILRFRSAAPLLNHNYNRLDCCRRWLVSGTSATTITTSYDRETLVDDILMHVTSDPMPVAHLHRLIMQMYPTASECVSSSNTAATDGLGAFAQLAPTLLDVRSILEDIPEVSYNTRSDVVALREDTAATTMGVATPASDEGHGEGDEAAAFEGIYKLSKADAWRHLEPLLPSFYVHPAYVLAGLPFSQRRLARFEGAHRQLFMMSFLYNFRDKIDFAHFGPSGFEVMLLRCKPDPESSTKSDMLVEADKRQSAHTIRSRQTLQLLVQHLPRRMTPISTALASLPSDARSAVSVEQLEAAALMFPSLFQSLDSRECVSMGICCWLPPVRVERDRDHEEGEVDAATCSTYLAAIVSQLPPNGEPVATDALYNGLDPAVRRDIRKSMGSLAKCLRHPTVAKHVVLSLDGLKVHRVIDKRSFHDDDDDGDSTQQKEACISPKQAKEKVRAATTVQPLHFCSLQDFRDLVRADHRHWSSRQKSITSSTVLAGGAPMSNDELVSEITAVIKNKTMPTSHVWDQISIRARASLYALDSDLNAFMRTRPTTFRVFRGTRDDPPPLREGVQYVKMFVQQQQKVVAPDVPAAAYLEDTALLRRTVRQCLVRIGGSASLNDLNNILPEGAREAWRQGPRWGSAKAYFRDAENADEFEMFTEGTHRHVRLNTSKPC